MVSTITKQRLVILFVAMKHLKLLQNVYVGQQAQEGYCCIGYVCHHEVREYFDTVCHCDAPLASGLSIPTAVTAVQYPEPKRHTPNGASNGMRSQIVVLFWH